MNWYGCVNDVHYLKTKNHQCLSEERLPLISSIRPDHLSQSKTSRWVSPCLISRISAIIIALEEAYRHYEYVNPVV